MRKMMILPLALLAASCATNGEPAIEVREIRVPTPVPCVAEADVPVEPAQVGDDLTGNAQHDLGIVAASALELRAWGRMLRALVVPGCTTVAP